MIRFDADELISMLRANGVDRLYHVTDASNWDTIQKSGIFSSKLIETKKVPGVTYGSDRISQIISRNKGLDQYVHLSFSSTPSSLPRSFEKGYMENLITLEISLEVFNQEDTVVSSYDPLDERAHRLSSASEIAEVDFEAAKAGAAFTSDTPADKAKAGATVLVHGAIPRSYILNADEIEAEMKRKSSAGERRKAIVFLVDLTSAMVGSVSLRGQFHATYGDAAKALTNSAVTQIMKSAITRSTVRDDVDVFLFEYSDSVGSLWRFPGKDSDRKTCPELYREMIIRLEREGARTVWTEDVMPHGRCNPADAIRMVSQIVERWGFEHRGCMNPLVIHVTNGRNATSNLMSITKEFSLIRQNSSFLWNYLIHEDMTISFPATSYGEQTGLGNEGEIVYGVSDRCRGPLAKAYCDLTGTELTEDRRTMMVNSDLSLLVSAFLGL